MIHLSHETTGVEKEEKILLLFRILFKTSFENIVSSRRQLLMFFRGLTFYYKNNIYKPTNNFPPVHKNNTANSLSLKTCLTFRETNYRNGVSHLGSLCHHFQIICYSFYYTEMLHINKLGKTWSSQWAF